MNRHIQYAAVSDVGCVRKNNEDIAYAAGKLVRDGTAAGETYCDGCVSFAVADGMGGYEGGEIASEIVCRSFASFIKSFRHDNTTPIVDCIKGWAKRTNKLVYESAALRPELSEMGTTFIALIFITDKLYLLNIGDSRCYRIRSGILKQLSTDHSERQRTGNPEVPSNLIYNFMGLHSTEFFSDVIELTPIDGDRYILCSDGLSDLVDEDCIESDSGNVDTLISAAKKNGGRDNITVIKIEL